MVDMLERIDVTKGEGCGAYAMSVALQGRMVREQMDNITRLEQGRRMAPRFERHCHDGLEKMRRRGGRDANTRAFRALLKLVTARMYDSPSMQKAVVGLEMEQPRLVDFQRFWADPIATMEEFCLCLERIQYPAPALRIPGTADQRHGVGGSGETRLKRRATSWMIFQIWPHRPR